MIPSSRCNFRWKMENVWSYCTFIFYFNFKQKMKITAVHERYRLQCPVQFRFGHFRSVLCYGRPATIWLMPPLAACHCSNWSVMFLLSYLVNKLPPSLASVESRSCDGRELDFEQLSDKRLKSRPKFSDAKASLGDKAESGRHNHTPRDPGMQYRTVVNAVATEHGRPSRGRGQTPSISTTGASRQCTAAA